MLLGGAGVLSFPDVTSVWFGESYNFLAVFKKSKYIWQFSHQLKQLLWEVGESKGMKKIGTVLPLPWTWGLFPAVLNHQKEFDQQKCTDSVTFQPPPIWLHPKLALGWRWLDSRC